jgi:GNAT superfamily N-acetyltransferase
MFIREAEEKDASILSKLLEQLGYPTTVEDSITRILLHKKEDYKLLIGVADQPIGFIALHWYNAIHHPRPIGRVVAFCIDERYRGKGLGSQLLKHAEDFFADKKCVKIELTSNLKRKESHDYYLHKGYRQVSMHFVKVLIEAT